MSGRGRAAGVSTVVIEASTGAQVLPPIGDDRATLSAWSAWQACSADMRRFPEYRDIAERLEVRT